MFTDFTLHIFCLLIQWLSGMSIRITGKAVTGGTACFIILLILRGGFVLSINRTACIAAAMLVRWVYFRKNLLIFSSVCYGIFLTETAGEERSSSFSVSLIRGKVDNRRKCCKCGYFFWEASKKAVLCQNVCDFQFKIFFLGCNELIYLLSSQM